MTGPARQGKDKSVKQVIKYYNRCPIGTFSRGNLIDKILIIILVSLVSCSNLIFLFPSFCPFNLIVHLDAENYARKVQKEDIIILDLWLFETQNPLLN